MTGCERCGSSAATTDATDDTTDTGTDTGADAGNETCVIESIKSDSLTITGDCPNLQIEVPEKEPVECAVVESLMPNDTIQVMRNGTCMTISIDNLLKALDCKKECL